jgi:hypothetical protein
MAYNVLNAFDMPFRSVQQPVIQQPVIHQQNVYPRNVDGELGHGPCITILIPTAARVPLQVTASQADLENDSEMWNMYLDEVKEEDNRITGAWKDDANSLVTFVSHNLLGPCVHLSDKLQDRSFLRNCWRIHH